MADKRMFAQSIVLSDFFLDMPMSARCLYFTLGMLADDDGFIGNPKAIMRQCGATDDDMKLLLAKRYLLGFESGVIVIKHWRINNYLRNDRHKDTTYQKELSQLTFDEKGAYTEAGSQMVGKCLPSGSIDKNSIDKNRLDKNSKDIWAETDKKYKKKTSFDQVDYDDSKNPKMDKAKLEEIIKKRGAK